MFRKVGLDCEKVCACMWPRHVRSIPVHHAANVLQRLARFQAELGVDCQYRLRRDFGFPKRLPVPYALSSGRESKIAVVSRHVM